MESEVEQIAKHAPVIRRLGLVGETLDEVLDRLEVELVDDPWDLELLEAQARLLQGSGQYDAALAVWRDVTALGPLHPRAHVAKAICLVELGAPAEAREELVTALSLESGLQEEIEDDLRLAGICY